MTDALPAFFSYDPGSTSITLANGTTDTADPAVATAGNVQTLTFTGLGSLASGQSIVINYTATPATGVSLGPTPGNTNTAQASGDDATGAAGNASGPYRSNTATATAYIDATDLAITKTHTGSFTAGSDGTYTLTVTNHGPSPTSGTTTVTDTLPAGESFVSGQRHRLGLQQHRPGRVLHHRERDRRRGHLHHRPGRRRQPLGRHRHDPDQRRLGGRLGLRPQPRPTTRPPTPPPS